MKSLGRASPYQADHTRPTHVQYPKSIHLQSFRQRAGYLSHRHDWVKALCLVATDDAKGLHRAIDRVYSYVPQQWCWAHKLRNSQSRGLRGGDLDEMLPFLDCPKIHRKKANTTNAIERAFREVRRKTRPMSCFQSSASVDRIVYGAIGHRNKTWDDNSLRGHTHFS